MGYPFYRYEISLLRTLRELGRAGKTKEVVDRVGKLSADVFNEHPEELTPYTTRPEPRWRNKVRWAREYLKRKRQLRSVEYGVWKITDAGRERLQIWEETGRDPDEGLATLHGVAELSEEEQASEEPAKSLDRRTRETGGILGVKGMVYEPINEQGVILLFAMLTGELGYMIEAIGPTFPDAHLRRRKANGRWEPIRAEFEYRASSFRTHKHEPKDCDLIICWENDWAEAPLEIIALKDVIAHLKTPRSLS